MAADRVDSVVNLCKRRGFVFPSSEIYGGTVSEIYEHFSGLIGKISKAAKILSDNRPKKD